MLQETLRNNITTIHGEIGLQWLQNLPQNLARLSKQWGLTELNPVENMTFNYVTKAVQGKRAVILKFSLDPDSLYQEMSALKYFAGHGAAKVIAYQDGALLLELVEP